MTVICTLGRAIPRGLDFVAKQEKAFKTNLLRQASQNFLITPTMYVYQSIYLAALGATALQLAIVYGVGGAAATLVTIPGGWLADRYGIKRIFLLGTVFMILGSLLFTMASDWTMGIPAMLIFNSAWALVMTVCPTVCGSCLESSERATGMQLCDTLSAAPRLVAPIVGAVVVAQSGGLSADGIRPLYWIQAAGLLVLLIFIYTQFTEPSKRTNLKTDSRFISGMKEVFVEGRMVKRWVVNIFLVSIPLFVSNAYLPLFAAEVKQADEYLIGTMIAATMVVPLLLSIPIGRFADMFGRKKTLYATIPLYCISLLLLIHAPNPTILIGSGVLQGFYTLCSVTSGTISAELVPIPLLGRWFGILGFSRGLAGMLGPIIAGILWSAIAPSSVFLFLLVIMLASSFILATMPETLKIYVT